MTKTLKIGVLSLVALGVLSFGALKVSAQSANTSTENTVFDSVIKKLNLTVTSDQLKNAFKDSRSEIRKADMAAALKTAVSEGKLTQAQADLATKIGDIRQDLMEANKDKRDNAENSTMTQEERKAAHESEVAAMEKTIAEKAGISVEQLTTLKDALKNANVLPAKGPHMMGKKGELGGMMMRK